MSSESAPGSDLNFVSPTLTRDELVSKIIEFRTANTEFRTANTKLRTANLKFPPDFKRTQRDFRLILLAG